MIRETYEQALTRLEERVYDNKRELDKTRKQRRTEFTDLYGVPYTSIGDANCPARFHISISQDLVYYLRFQFKLEIQPFLSTVQGGTQPASVSVNETSLSINENAVTPNPHTHGTQPHSHNLISGITVTNTTSTDFTVTIGGIDITPYLMEQHNGQWISGEGLYPSADIEDNYDILDAAGLMTAEGRTADAEKILVPEFKEVTVSSDGPFSVTLYLYLKYSNLGR